MRKRENVVFTNMCMVCSGTNVLVQDRKDPDWPGITFPGGHVEEGESFTDAVVREVWEETGLKIASPRLCGIKDWMQEDGSRYMVLLYRADRFDGELSSSAEGEVFWVELGEMKKLALAEGMETQLEVFLREETGEDFWYLADGKWVEVLK